MRAAARIVTGCIQSASHHSNGGNGHLPSRGTPHSPGCSHVGKGHDSRLPAWRPSEKGCDTAPPGDTIPMCHMGVGGPTDRRQAGSPVGCRGTSRLPQRPPTRAADPSGDLLVQLPRGDDRPPSGTRPPTGASWDLTDPVVFYIDSRLASATLREVSSPSPWETDLSPCSGSPPPPLLDSRNDEADALAKKAADMTLEKARLDTTSIYRAATRLAGHRTARERPSYPDIVRAATGQPGQPGPRPAGTGS